MRRHFAGANSSPLTLSPNGRAGLFHVPVLAKAHQHFDCLRVWRNSGIMRAHGSGGDWPPHVPLRQTWRRDYGTKALRVSLWVKFMCLCVVTQLPDMWYGCLLEIPFADVNLTIMLSHTVDSLQSAAQASSPASSMTIYTSRATNAPKGNASGSLRLVRATLFRVGLSILHWSPLEFLL